MIPAPPLIGNLPRRGTHWAHWQDLDKEDEIPHPFRQASAEEVHALALEQATKRKKTDKTRSRRLGAEGFEVEGAGEVLF